MTAYKIRQAVVTDKQAIYDLLIDSYYTDMPLYAACNTLEPPSIDKWPALQELGQGLTVVAVNNEDKIVGVAINVLPKDDGSAVSIPESLERFVNELDKSSNSLVSKLTETTMETSILAVAKTCRRNGISKKLVQETENVAKRNNHANIFAIATGAYMAATFRGKNWKTTHTYFYKDHAKVDPNFRMPPFPHDSVNVFEKILM